MATRQSKIRLKRAYEPPGPEDLAVEMITRDDLVMVASAHHPWATRKKLTIDDLTVGKWVLREDDSGTRAAFVKALGDLGVPYENLNIAIELPSNEAVSPWFSRVRVRPFCLYASAADAVKAGTLKRLPVSIAPRAFCAVQHADRYRSRAVSALLEILRIHSGL